MLAGSIWRLKDLAISGLGRLYGQWLDAFPAGLPNTDSN